MQLILVMQAINRVRQTVWKQQENSFFDCATFEADGTIVETAGEKKDGIGISYKGQWGYHPLVVTLAETQELLYIHNRPGNRVSEEDSAFFYDLAIEQCKKAGFRKIVLRGDTAFSSTEHLDRRDASGVKFVLGSNESLDDVSIREVIRAGNKRCDQENTISQLGGSGALRAPLDNLESNMAYMVLASLAWTLKTWSGMLICVKGNEGQRRIRRVRREARNRIVRMEFWTYLNSLMLLPAQVIRSSRRRVFRLLTYRPTVDLLMTMHDHLRQPLRC